MEHDDSWMQEGSSQSQQSVEESSESSYQDSQSPIKPRANLPMSAPPPSLGTIAGAIAGAAPGYNALSGDSHRTFSKELKMAGVMSMVDGVPPSCVSASLTLVLYKRKFLQNLVFSRYNAHQTLFFRGFEQTRKVEFIGGIGNAGVK